MNLGLTYDQLAPVANGVRADIVTYDASQPRHQDALYSLLPQFLGTLGDVHGASFPRENLHAVKAAIDAKIIRLEFLHAALEACDTVAIVGLATGAPTFGVEWGKNNQLRIFPVYHGEDMAVDKLFAQQFKNATRCQSNSNGIGAGTWFMREQIRQSLGNLNWVFAGRDNEHSPDNPPIIGLMGKFGAVDASRENSAVLELNGLTPDMRKRWWRPDVQTRALPKDRLGLVASPNHFLTHWASEDGRQQIAIVFTRMASTFDGKPVVWTKIKSNGQLPESHTLKDVLTSLLVAGVEEMESPERHWGIPAGKPLGEADLSHVFGYPAPLMHIHANNEPAIIQALRGMQADYRRFGHEIMVSGVMDLRNLRDPIITLGQPVPAPTLVNVINPQDAANEPIFDLGPERGRSGICREQAARFAGLAA